MQFSRKQFVGATSWEGVVVFGFRVALCERCKTSTPTVRSRRRSGKSQTFSLRL